LAEIETIQNLIFALPLECFNEGLGVMKALCDCIGSLVSSRTPLFQTHGREMSTNIMNFLHTFPPEGHYDTHCSTNTEDSDQHEILWSSIGDSIYSAADVAGGIMNNIYD
jgi:hypothetical protein